jgi:hypothetical protein
MDPNATLEKLRAALAVLAHDDGTTDADLKAVREAAEAAEALDEWLSRGGFLPSAWER